MTGQWADWIGKGEEQTDMVTVVPAQAMAATLLDKVWRPKEGEALVPLWHWLYFLPLVPFSEVGPDGHPKRGGFLPPIPLERRMWAGGRLEFHTPIRVGETLTRRSTIQSVTEKQGKAGSMVFVTVTHEVAGPNGPAVTEEQDIVYIAMPKEFNLPKPVPAPDSPDWAEPFLIDPVRLFRFSALTFNGHRIHYDRPYAMEVEKYPGLVVHGPFQAMMLMASAVTHQPGRVPKHFSFRGVRPLFDFDNIEIRGVAEEDGAAHTLATVTKEGHMGMRAEIVWAE